MVFPVVMHGCESWAIRKAEHQRTDAFELLCWGRLLRVRWTARRSNQSILKEISLEYPLRDLCWCWSSDTLATWFEELTHWKRPWCWERLKTGREGDNEDEMVGWHHWFDGHAFEQAPGVGDGQKAWHAAVHGVSKGWTNWATQFADIYIYIYIVLWLLQ